MKKTFTRAEILQGSGCYKNEIGKAESIIGDKQQMNIQEILDLEISLKDKFWFVRNNCGLTDRELRLLAIGCATIVLTIYESKYPDNKAPREAIQAAQDKLNGIISLDELRVKRDAAFAVVSAAVADDENADDMMYVGAAVNAAAFTTPSFAACLAADADGVYKQQLLEYLKDFIK